MPQDGLLERSRSAIVKEPSVVLDGDKAKSPQRWRSPFEWTGLEVGTVVAHVEAEVVQEQVGVRLDCLLRQPRDVAWPSREGFDVATRASEFAEVLLASLGGRVPFGSRFRNREET